MSITHSLSVWLIDDETDIRHATVDALELAGYDAQGFAEARSCLKHLTPDYQGVIVSDLRMPGMDGVELANRIRAVDSDIPVVLISGHADVGIAVQALRDGAFDFLTKPFSVDRLTAAIDKALAHRRLVLENRKLRAAADVAAAADSPLIGESPAMVRLRSNIRQLAEADVDVMLEGETGTGKELVAILLHRKGPRRGKPFVPINCGALPESHAAMELFGYTNERGSQIAGRLEAADKGTLFLDEIDSMSPNVQVKLLRFLEEREVVPVGGGPARALDVHVIAASKTGIDEAIAQGRFREDLFYRLNVVRLRIPPLRERREDIPLLFAHFLSTLGGPHDLDSFSMTDAIRRHLVEHDWPGNVRELRNFALNAALDLEDAEAETQKPQSLGRKLEAYEASLLREALATTEGDIRATMAMLDLPRKTLYDKLSRHDIDLASFRARAG